MRQYRIALGMLVKLPSPMRGDSWTKPLTGRVAGLGLGLVFVSSPKGKIFKIETRRLMSQFEIGVSL